MFIRGKTMVEIDLGIIQPHAQYGREGPNLDSSQAEPGLSDPRGVGTNLPSLDAIGRSHCKPLDMRGQLGIRVGAELLKLSRFFLDPQRPVP